MKRFLWLVAALAAMVMVGCANNAGGGDSPKGTENNNNVVVEGWWKYHTEVDGVSLTTYIKYDKDGNVLRAGTDKEYTGQYLETYQVNLIYDKLKNFDSLTKITDEAELPSWAKNEGPATDDSFVDQDGSSGSSDDGALNLGITKKLSMLVGESIGLADFIDEYDVRYEVQSGDDVISVEGNTLSATSVGTAILKATTTDDENRTWNCTITVSAEGFTGSALDYKMIGIWYYDDSHIQLNSDKTGYMKVYLNGQLIQDCSFNWTTQETGAYKFLEITDGTDYVNKDYRILEISGIEFRIKGYLGFGMPEETTWVKK